MSRCGFCHQSVLIILSFVMGAASPTASGQGRTSAIHGVVRDESHGVVAAATIRVYHVQTGITRTSVSDADGSYRVPLLEVGEYEVTAEKAGFKASNHTGILLELDHEAVVDHVLEVGEIAEVIEVSGEERVIEAMPSTISSVVDATTIQELPLNGRDYLQLATLQAGAPIARAQARDVNNGYGIQISISGSRPFQNNFRLDGVSLTSYNGSTPGSINGVNLGAEAIREFSVLRSTYGAQYGRAGGGIVNAVTNSGTNDFHGTFFYFHRNDNFDARNFFDKEAPLEFRRHQFGSSLGGPIVRNKAFIFVNYEGLREVRGNTTINTTLTEDARRGILSTGRVTVDPVMAKVAALYPLPNGTVFRDTGLFVFPNDEVGNEDFITTRIDGNLSDFDKLFFRYSFDDGDRSDETAFALGKRSDSTRMQSLALEESHIFSPTVLNSARFGLMRSFTVSGQTETQVPGTDDPDLAFLPGGRAIGVVDVTVLSEFPGGSGALDSDIHAFNSFQFSDDLTWTRGRHSIKMGGRLERTHFNTDSQNRVSGEYRFRSLAEFLTNNPDRFRAQLPSSDTVRGHRQWIGAWYLQETWKATPHLTLDLGLRHEWTTVPDEVNGKIANLDEVTSPQMRVGGPLFNNPSIRNFAPRIGLAWDFSGGGDTVLRAGYGIFHDLVLSQFIVLLGVRNPPFFSRGSTRNLNPGDFPKGGFQVFASDPNAELRTERIPRDISQPYVQQWNLNVEQSLGSNSTARLAYVGSHGLNLSSLTEDANLAEPTLLSDGRLFFPEDGEKINPTFSRIRNRTFDAYSFYHGLQAQFRRRMSRGVQAQVSYSYSKSIDDSSSFFGGGESANFIGLPLNGHPQFNRGLSDHDVRHYFVGSGIWQLPSPKNPGLKAILGGWQLGSIVTYASGLPTTVTLAYDAAGTQTGRSDGSSGQRPDLAPGRSNNPVTGNPNQWVDPAAFLRPQDGFLGNLGRNTIIGPDLASVDFSMVKRMPMPALGEGASLDFRVEFFNLFNRANFDLPEGERMELFDSTSRREDFARITSADKSREIQFGLKLRF